MSAPSSPPGDRRPSQPSPQYRPSERFWPYVDPQEEPSAEELAALDPDLHDVLFGATDRPFSMTLSFPLFESAEYERAVALAKGAPEYREVGSGETLRHRARFYPENALELRNLFEIVGPHDECLVLVDDRAVPFARELWLPLMWLLISRE